ncbi:uncharacterized protein DUF4291 [Streptomyces sp. 846.5]|nr:DUF4291 domain-containing protein [Streptomyces sp. 846.5]TDU06449.1 uncharacterized protein DUF4291 [Streptomyces sp. 846.5]
MPEVESVPVPSRQIRAAHTVETVTVYQAYGPAIAATAAATGRFGSGFKRERMTWIKPSFLWMMYRSDWASAPGQERVLAVELRRDGFEAALDRAAASSYLPRLHNSREAWKRELRRSDVRFQWDPERDLDLRTLPWRSLQLGLSGVAVDAYVDEWTIGITDVTDLAHRVRDLRRVGDTAGAVALLPVERPYPLPDGLAARVDAAPLVWR